MTEVTGEKEKAPAAERAYGLGQGYAARQETEGESGAAVRGPYGPSASSDVMGITEMLIVLCPWQVSMGPKSNQ